MNKKTLKLITIIMPLLFTALLLSSCDEMLRKEEEFSFEQRIGGTESTLLDIDSRNGFIEVEPWNMDYFRIEGKKYIQGTGNLEQEIEKIQIKYKEIGSTIRIYVDFPENDNFFRGWSYGANFSIKIPEYLLASLNRLDMDTSNGSIALKDFNGSVIADTSNGSINVQDCTGDFKLKSSNGSITLTNLKGQIDADTSNSSIRINNCFLSGFSNVFDTSNGAITGNFTPSLSGNMRFDTSNGRIELSIPRDSNLEFTAKTSNASVSVENLNMRLTEDSRKRKSGKINDGGARLELESSNGNVKIIGE